jgi:sugar/nucleoside kinase (ribokinase family)
VDVFFPVRQLPQPGDKQYYDAETCSTDVVVGGVTLNHLSWARALGAPSGLMALQGADANGEMIRAKLRELREDYVRLATDKAYKRRVIEEARTRDNAWTELKGTTRPLRIK